MARARRRPPSPPASPRPGASRPPPRPRRSPRRPRRRRPGAPWRPTRTRCPIPGGPEPSGRPRPRIPGRRPGRPRRRRRRPPPAPARAPVQSTRARRWPGPSPPADPPPGARALSSRPAMDRYPATLEHEQLLVRRGTRSGRYCIVAVHSTARGPALGGCRMWRYEDSRSAMRDALRLSRAMTYKSAVAGLPLGGGKGVIMLPAEIDARRRKAVLRDFGDTVERLNGSHVTAEDVGPSARHMATIADQARHVTGRSRRRGGSGDPSPWTALGVEAAIRASLERKLGSADPKGRTVVVSGLGHVGLALAQLLVKAGAKLVVTDIDRSKKALADKLGA